MMSFEKFAASGRKLTREDRIQAAWDNVPALFGYTILKLDCDGRLISRYEYGKSSTLGWEIDHIIPICVGGSDAPWNVRARHHSANRGAGGTLPTRFGI
jgi:5-methylcytosine-specific restriction endonuclease McrA